MFLVVDLTRRFVLLLIHGATVGARQFAAVGLAHSASLAIDALLFVFQVLGFARGQLPAANAVRDAVLLVLFALADFTLAVVRRIRIVLVVVDILGQVVLLAIEFCAVGGSQVAIVLGPHIVFFFVQALFLGFQVLRFAGSQLPALDAIGDAVLLIRFALADGRLAGRSRRASLRRGTCRAGLRLRRGALREGGRCAQGRKGNAVQQKRSRLHDRILSDVSSFSAGCDIAAAVHLSKTRNPGESCRVILVPSKTFC